MFLKKKEKEEKKKTRGHQKEQQLEAFFRWKDSCVYIKQSGKCDAIGLHYCSKCKSVLKSACTKMACKMAGWVIIFPSYNKNSDR